MSDITPFSLSLSNPLQTSQGTIDTRDGLLVTIDLDGTRGSGEATPLPGWTESLETCSEALERALHVGDSVGWDEALDTLDDTPAARHGLSLALCDARSRSEGVPLYRHLGGERTERVPVNATIGDGTVDETVEAATTAIEGGFTALKIKIGARAVETEIERLSAVRDAVDSGVELRADANGAWTQDEAQSALDGFANLGVAFVEQPLSPTDLAGHAALRGEVGIALDEALVEHPIEAVIDADAADVLVLKPMVLGGPDRARKGAHIARTAGLEVVVTTTVDGALARAAAVHVAASLSHPPACGLATADRLTEDFIDDPAPVGEGHAHVPQTPGNVPDASSVGR